MTKANFVITWSVFPLVQTLGGNPVAVFRNSLCYAEQKLQGDFLLQSISSFSHCIITGQKASLLGACSVFPFGVLHSLDCTEMGSGIWFTNKRATVGNTGELWFLRPSETEQFHVVGTYMHTDTCKFLSSFDVRLKELKGSEQNSQNS